MPDKLQTQGIYTSEFWLTLAIIFSATFLLAFDKVDQATWAIAVGIQGGSYALARGVAKRS